MKSRERLCILISEVTREIEEYRQALKREILRRRKLSPEKLMRFYTPSEDYIYYKGKLRKNALIKLNHWKQILERLQ